MIVDVIRLLVHIYKLLPPYTTYPVVFLIAALCSVCVCTVYFAFKESKRRRDGVHWREAYYVTALTNPFTGTTAPVHRLFCVQVSYGEKVMRASLIISHAHRVTRSLS